MWESLATTRSQDRALHGAAKVMNVVLGFIMLPLWFAGQRLAGVMRRGLAESEQPALATARPERDLDALLAELKSFPNRLRPTRWATQVKGIPDLLLLMLTQKRQTVNLGYSYPSQFDYHYIESADGERIAATIATHDEPRPGLIVVHGLFSSRHFDYVREIAVRAYYDWGFNVAAIDLRSFGLTEMLSNAPCTAGWKEGEDILATAAHLKSLGSTSVGAVGISLGSSSVMNACHHDTTAELLDGGILAVGGPADVRVAIEYIDTVPPPTHPFFGISVLFRSLLTGKVRNLGWPDEIADFTMLAEHVLAPYYEISLDELYERASAKNFIADARVPVLVLHGEDDEIVPVEHARELERAAGGAENVRVWIVPGGGHAAFDALDRDWTYRVYRTFFERLAVYEPVAAQAAAAA